MIWISRLTADEEREVSPDGARPFVVVPPRARDLVPAVPASGVPPRLNRELTKAITKVLGIPEGGSGEVTPPPTAPSEQQ